MFKTIPKNGDDLQTTFSGKLIPYSVICKRFGGIEISGIKNQIYYKNRKIYETHFFNF